MANKKIVDFLLKNGVRPHLKGFRYLCDATEILTDVPDCKLTQYVYPLIAKKHNTTWSRVERCIRTAIHTSRGALKKMRPSEFFALAKIKIGV